MSIVIRLGKCTEDPRKLDKAANFESSNPVSVTADLKDSCSVMDPQFILSTQAVSLVNYNYIQVQSWGRYYYIQDIVTMPGSRVAIRCAEDVLTSNAADIKNLTGFVSRSESSKTPFVPNSSYHVQANRQCETIAFNRTPFVANYGTDQVYLLTVMGGVHGS